MNLSSSSQKLMMWLAHVPTKDDNFHGYQIFTAYVLLKVFTKLHIITLKYSIPYTRHHNQIFIICAKGIFSSLLPKMNNKFIFFCLTIVLLIELFCSFFGRIWGQQKVFLKLSDLYYHLAFKKWCRNLCIQLLDTLLILILLVLWYGL